MFAADSGRGTTLWRVDRWDAEQAAWVARRSGLVEPGPAAFAAAGVKPYLTTEQLGNVVTNAGWQALLASATGSGTPMFTSSKGRLGVGNGTTTPAATDTDLSAAAGSSNRLYKFMAAAPTVGTGVNRTWTFVATFQATDAIFTWNEFGLDQGTADGTTVTATFFNHALSSQGAKTSGQVWTATAVVSFT